MAPVVKVIEAQADQVKATICVTGQHREMLVQVLELFEIEAAYDLNVMRPNQSLSSLTANLITGLDEVMTEARPDWVLVQGDTTSAMAASLVAFYQGIKIGHIEAGLRTYNRRQPFPEEVNRRITDLLCDLYFAPTERARANLLQEGVPLENILVTGNTVIDALLMTVQQVRDEPLHEVDADIDGKRLILVTSHRRENFGEPFNNICAAIEMLAHRYLEQAHFVFPVHFNPNVRKPAHEMLGSIPNVTLIDPVDYRTMVKLLDRAYMVLTDSGGIQEEAPSLNSPVLILRDVTERQEVVDAGAAILVGSDSEAIVHEASRLMEDLNHYRRMSMIANPYGDGTSSQQIVNTILESLPILTISITLASFF